VSFPSAGQYENALLDATGQPAANASVTVYSGWGSSLPTATLYTDQTKATNASNPALTDAYGNLGIFAEPGAYTLSYSAGGQAFNIPIIVGPYPADLKLPYAQQVANNFSSELVAASSSYTTGSGGNGNDQVTILGAGWWFVEVGSFVAGPATPTEATVTLLQNGAAVAYWNTDAGTIEKSVGGSKALLCAANDVFTLEYSVGSQGSVTFAPSGSGAHLVATYLHAGN
jgi:hypothetical protein